ncbi:UNVERIFIED_CONTAM: putative glycosyltransferase [Sesamum angustifolium]|uniref:Glycosyltransferase n=1 Tax=Sesamum angustifolium TaxID=2727405 RepID=A0AAW2N447_9LAMI
MPLPLDSSSPSSSCSKLVCFVVIPLILLSALVLVLNHNPSTTFSWPLSFLDAMNSHSGARAPAATAEGPETGRLYGGAAPCRATDTGSVTNMVEASLAQARATIHEAQRNNETSYDPDYVPTGPMYRNPNAFLSKSLGILGIEGIIHQIEISQFRTRDPGKAHVYFIPLSVQSIVAYAYVRHNERGVPAIELCNANLRSPLSLPEIYLPHGTMDGLIGGPPPSERYISFLWVRQVLMEQWKDKDPDIQIHEYLPKNLSYYGMFQKSKYCICPSGWEVASPRMVEGLYMGCVPVLLKDHF